MIIGLCVCRLSPELIFLWKLVASLDKFIIASYERYGFIGGQANRRVLATDEWLRVEGCDCVYALGDCATINQRKVMLPILFNFFNNLLMKISRFMLLGV